MELVKTDSRSRLVLPGHSDEMFLMRENPDGSILLYRVESTEPGVMMPELGRTLADPAAVELLRAWIAGMDG